MISFTEATVALAAFDWREDSTMRLTMDRVCSRLIAGRGN